MHDLELKIKDYVNNNCKYVLERAIVYEVFYQFQYLKDNNYDEVKNVDLTVDDIVEIANNILNTTFMNEEFNELIQYYLWKKIPNEEE